MYELINLIGYSIRIYSYIILAYILVGYFPDARRSKFYEILRRMCEPFLNLFRFATFSGISLAPIVGILFLQFLYMFLIMIVQM